MRKRVPISVWSSTKSQLYTCRAFVARNRSLLPGPSRRIRLCLRRACTPSKRRTRPGGYVIVDDMCLEGCAKAVADYRQANAIADEITVIDWTGIY
jgi:hypothetical protein